jgi:isoleucyl-tRNA synthetase
LGTDRIELDSEDIQVRLQANPGWAAAQGTGCVVVLNTELTPALIREGNARDVVRLIQDRRKELDCQYTDRIAVAIVTNSAELKTAIQENSSYIENETLAHEITFAPLAGVPSVTHEVAGESLELFVKVV